MDFGSKFSSGLDYQSFLQNYGTEIHRKKWHDVHEQIELSAEQKELLVSFTRQMKVLVLAGTWCGDCVNQCPIFNHFSNVNPMIQIRYFDRDENTDLGELLMTCGAPRVPALLFLSEDNHVCGRYGDRTLSKYRDMAATELGPTCPTGLGPIDEGLLRSVTQEWLNEFERIQLMLRLSGRLRTLHQD